MGGKPSASDQTIGYRYFMSLHMGICRGPVDEVVKIKIGDLEAWPNPGTGAFSTSKTYETYTELIVEGFFLPKGSVVEVTSDPDTSKNGVWLKGSDGEWVFLSDGEIVQTGVTDTTQIQINAEGLFGGTKKEGGVEGKLDVLMGKPDQLPTAQMIDLLGGLVPGFRHRLTTWFDGMLTAMNPYPKAWKFRLRRSEKGWMNDDTWYPERAAVWMAGGLIKAMNPAHIIYECATNKSWGRGLDPSRIDENSFIYAANKLCAESFGLCFLWTRQEGLDQFVQIVVNHIGAALYVNRETGLLTLRLIRDDYEIDDVPVFDKDSGLLSVEEDETAAQDTGYNEIVVGYKDPISNRDRVARWQNPAARQAQGSVASTTTQYPGIPTYDLAMRVAERDGRIQTGGLRRFKVRLDRRGWRISPAGPFAISAPERGIEYMILRAGEAHEEDGAFLVTAVQDVFGLSATTYAQEQESGWVEPSREPAAPAAAMAFELTYRDLARNLSAPDLDAIDMTDSYVGGMATKPTAPGVGINYSFQTKIDTDFYVQRDTGDWTPNALLDGPLAVLATSFVYKDAISFDADTFGSTIQIDDEIMEVVTVNTITKTITVERGCVDTIPEAHADEARLWFRDPYIANDVTAYADAEVISAKFLTRTTSATLSEGGQPAYDVTADMRQGRPYPPGDVKVRTLSVLEELPPFDDGLDNEITWAHRDRITQHDQLVGHTAPDVGPEAGTTYNLRVYGPDGVTLLRSDTESGTSWTYDAAMIAADGNPKDVFVELESTRDAMASYYKYRFRLELFNHDFLDTDEDEFLDTDGNVFVDAEDI